MCEIQMARYTFELSRSITVRIHGTDTKENFQKAKSEALRQAKNEINNEWITDMSIEEYKEYENEYKEIG